MYCIIEAAVEIKKNAVIVSTLSERRTVYTVLHRLVLVVGAVVNGH